MNNPEVSAMKKQTKQFIEMALTSDETVSGEHKKQIMEAVNLEPYLPDKIFLNQNETAHVLSMTRQTVRNLVKQDILHPVDINGQGLLRYRVDELKSLGRPKKPPYD